MIDFDHVFAKANVVYQWSLYTRLHYYVPFPK